MGRLIGSQHAASVRLQYLNGCFGRDGCRVERPTKMLASVAATDRLTVMVQHFLIEGVDQLELFTYGWRRFKSATCEITRNLSRKPRTSLRGAADHDCIATKRCQRDQRIGDTGAFGDPMRVTGSKLHYMDSDTLPLATNNSFAFATHQASTSGHFRNHQPRA